VRAAGSAPGAASGLDCASEDCLVSVGSRGPTWRVSGPPYRVAGGARDSRSISILLNLSRSSSVCTCTSCSPSPVWNRATRVYTTCTDRPTRPSYLKRLLAFPDRPRNRASGADGLNQIEKISMEFAKKPGFSNLSFIILRPADLHDQFRPGYVPCAIAGDFKFRDGRIDFNVMFHTSDALALGVRLHLLPAPATNGGS